MRRIAQLVFCLLFAAPAGCRSLDSKAPAGGTGDQQIVARIDDQIITVGDVQRRLGQAPPYVRARYATTEKKKELLESMIQFEVMAKEARAKGYGKDPEVQRVMKQTMISEFIKKDFDSKSRAEDIPGAEVEKYFKDHPEEFDRPEQVRVSQILVKDKTVAAKVIAEAKAAPGLDQKVFRDLVAKYSEDTDSKQRGGDLTFFDRNTALYPKPIVAAAFALKEMGDVSAPIPTDKGFTILKLTGKRPGFSRPLAEVRTQIRQRIWGRLRTDRMKAFTTEMRAKIKVEIFEDRLAHVVVEPPPPTPDANTP